MLFLNGRHRPLLIGLASAALSASSAGAAQAAPAFSSPTTISNVTAASSALTGVAVNDAGQGAAVWTQFTQNPNIDAIEAAFRSSDGTWSAPQTISSPGISGAHANVAIDASGTATFAFSESNPETVVVISHTAAGFGAAQRFSEPGGDASGPTLSVNSRGDTVVAWEGYHSLSQDAIVAALRPAGGTFGLPVTVSDSGPGVEATAVASSINEHGDIALAYDQSTDGAARRIELVRRPASGEFSASQAITPATGAASASPSVVIDPAGNSTVAWYQAFGATNDVVRVDASGTVGTPQTLGSPADFAAAYPRLAVDGQGQVTAAWRAGRIYVATAPPSGSFGAATVLDEAPADGYPAVAANQAGDTLVTWAGSNGVRTAWRGAGAGAFEAPVDLGTIGGYEPVTAVSSTTATVVSSVGADTAARVIASTATFAAAVTPTPTPTPQATAQPQPQLTPPDTTPPTFAITSAKLVRGAKHGKKKATTLVVTVSTTESAFVALTLDHSEPGRWVSQSCRALSGKHPTPKAKRCTRVLEIGAPILANVRAGTSTFTIPKAPTAAGKYRLTISGHDTAGNRAKAVSRFVTVH